jgi:hypothetical protein
MELNLGFFAGSGWDLQLFDVTNCRDSHHGASVMRKLKRILSLASVLAAGIIATTDFAEARHYRRVAIYDEDVVSAGTCTPPPPPRSYIYPAANWEPFFRRHYYRYGPILVCSPSIVTTTNVISVRY